MKTRQMILLLAVLVNCLSVMAQYADVKDIPYVETQKDSVGRRVLDIHYDTEKEGVPVIIWFHGGGLIGGEKEVPRALREKGYVVVAPSYRYVSDTDISDVINDAAGAVAWTFKNISKYGGDPSKIIVTGHSAGGYLASMIGLDKRWLSRYGVDADSIAALIPYSGQVITHYAERNKRGIDSLQPVIDEYAPLTYVRKDAPPYVIISGDRERELFGRYEENAYMMRMLKLTGHPYVKIYELDGFDHGAMVEPGHHILLNEINEILNM